MDHSVDQSTLLPLPRRHTRGQGAGLPADRRLEVRYRGVRTDRLEWAAARLLAARSGGSGPAVPLIIDCAAAGADYPALGDDEAYVLDIGPAAIELCAAEEWGVLRGMATLTQLCCSDAPAPVLHIEDRPRFAWRGVMLDVARHFMPLADLLRTLDAMAVFKLNVLHLHLSDDQGIRFASRRYPDLASAEHYSSDDLRRLLRHAADLGIRVVPELDVPGHATAWLTAYPQWGNRPARPTRRFGVHPACLDPTRPDVLLAVTELFTELAGIFPDGWVHFGGDEVHPQWWREDAGIADFMARNNLTDVAALQARFNRHVAAVLTRLGKRAIGWDEVLHPDLPANVAVQAWRGVTARDRALAAGRDCVLSAPYYLDLFYPADLHYGFDPAAPEDQLLAAEDALLEDSRLSHVAAGMAWTRQWRQIEAGAAAQTRGTLLGAEACLWTELVNPRVLDVRLWSRLPALAERFWSPAEVTDVADLQRRLDAALRHLPRWAGVNVSGDLWQLIREAGVSEAWDPLVEMLEPVKWYGRLLGEEALAARLRGTEMPQARPYNLDSPLNRVVDALPPEAVGVRQLEAVLHGEALGDARARQALGDLAAAWANLPERAGPAELAVAARRLADLGRIILAVLDGRTSAAAARSSVSEAGEPMGEYLLAAVPLLGAWLERREGAAGNHE